MDFFDVIQQRRSIRKFENQPVEPGKVDQLIETFLRAPTARGAHSCECVVVENVEIRTALAKARPSGGAFIAEAPLAVVVCSDPQKALPWIEDASIAASHLQLAATALGLGSCWFHIREKEYNENQSSHQYVADLLQLPENLQVECIIAIGYPAEGKPPYDKTELPFEQISHK